MPTKLSPLVYLSASILPLLVSCGREHSAPTTVPIVTRSNPAPVTLSDGWESHVLLAVIRPGEDIAEICNDYKCTIEGSLPDQVSFRIGVPPGTYLSVIEQYLRDDPRVSGVSRNYYGQSSESRQSTMAFDEGELAPGLFHDQEAFRRIGVPRAQAVVRANGSRPGRGPLIAIIDTGADLNHVELRGRIDPASYDFLDNDTEPVDAPDGLDNDGDGLFDEGAGHGTHVAGLVAAVAPDSRLLILRILNSDGIGTAYDLARAIEYAALHGASVINMSLGMLQEVPAVDEALEFADDRGCILVASAGNQGASNPEEYPARAQRVWAIAASDSLDRGADFTSFFQDVALCAPGTRLRSAFWNGGYAIWSGTSMSAPLVAGGAALLRQIHPNWDRDEVLGRLAKTVDPVQAMNPEQVDRLGAGRLNLGSALEPDWPGQSRDTDPGELRSK